MIRWRWRRKPSGQWLYSESYPDLKGLPARYETECERVYDAVSDASVPGTETEPAATPQEATK